MSEFGPSMTAGGAGVATWAWAGTDAVAIAARTAAKTAARSFLPRARPVGDRPACPLRSLLMLRVTGATTAEARRCCGGSAIRSSPLAGRVSAVLEERRDVDLVVADLERRALPVVHRHVAGA